MPEEGLEPRPSDTNVVAPLGQRQKQGQRPGVFPPLQADQMLGPPRAGA